MNNALKIDDFVLMDFPRNDAVEERLWPHEHEEFDVIIAVGACKTGILVSAPPKVMEVVRDNNDDNIEEIPIEGLDADEGIYRCRIKFYFIQGYFEGYPAPGESDWGFKVVSTEEIKLNG